MSTIPVQILRRQDRARVDAVLHTNLLPKSLVAAEKEWGPVRLEAVESLLEAGKIDEVPQHHHWNWGWKSRHLRLLAYQSFGIECAGQWQGLLMVKLAGMEARLEPDKGKPLVYIDYLESAPWNLSTMVDTPLYGGIGPLLMQTAVQLSYDEGFHGRIGLHALPQAEAFYRDDCGMHNCGPDASYENMSYYEMTREIAANFTSNSNPKGGLV
ncbi:MAG: GNAT family N-acetyltransferase [Cyanobacteria bacterium J06627_8]